MSVATDARVDERTSEEGSGLRFSSSLLTTGMMWANIWSTVVVLWLLDLGR